MAATHCSACSKAIGFLASSTTIGDRVYCGDCAARVAADNKAQIEQAIRSALISTTPHLEGYSIAAYLGTVAAFSVLKFDEVQDWFADIGDWLGGKSSGYARKFADLHSDVEAKLKFQAVTRGGNAVVGVAFNVQFIETNSGEKKTFSNGDVINRKLLVSGAGTAVSLAPR